MVRVVSWIGLLAIMRQKVIIVLTVFGVAALLIFLNAATLAPEEKKRDSEWKPDRSTYHSGPTGTRAFYDFLNESGNRVIRWRQPTEQLLGPSGEQIQTFVVVGTTQLGFDDDQANTLLEWVRRGGRLVIIDRGPQAELMPHSGAWGFDIELAEWSGFGADPENVQVMTENVKPLRPILPAALTRDVQEVMPSRLATRIKISVDSKSEGGLNETDAEPATSEATPDEITGAVTTALSPAPVVYLGDLKGALLADYSYGRGRIVVLSDPYIVANNGIRLKDNLQLALNIVTASGGLIAFDEYHQGRGVTQNALIGYFSGTPVLALCSQLCLLLLLLLWTRGRRFARPLPLPHIDRRSKLEFVASMAELQERSRAFDLAIENIYSRTRRVLARYAGVDYNTPRSEVAARVASRSSLDSHQLETLMRQCEETINGAPINWRRSIDLVKRLREVERTLGLRMRSRDERQAAENI
jgi:hypothetical protein